MKNLILALDFGGTKHAAALGTPGQKQWLASRRAISPPNADAKSDLEIMFLYSPTVAGVVAKSARTRPDSAIALP